MTAQRDIRVWDSSVIIAYLGNEIAYRDVLLDLIEQGEHGRPHCRCIIARHC